MLTSPQVKTIQKNHAAVDDRLPLIFAALGEPGRFRIFKLLTNYQDICVTDIANILGISVPAASQQLKFMELSGIVKRQRSGQMICYELRTRDPLVRSIIKLLQVNAEL